MFKILTLNNISPIGLEKLPTNNYTVSDDEPRPDAIILRSFKMHDMEIPGSLKAVGRAGAGVNNIPVEKLAGMGIPVFNAPGANANAVKELVISSLLIASRNLYDAIKYTEELKGRDEELSKAVEAGKKKYAGSELPGKTIGVVGLGAIGRMVANVCLDLGMNVIGFDPALTVDGAWQLSSKVKRIDSIDKMLPQVDFMTVHVPLIDATKDMVNETNIGLMKETATILNLARGGIINDEAVCHALDAGKLHSYITDFPTNRTKDCEKVVNLPHLGASTAEAEDNCAIMVAQQLMDYLENGNIVNSVNFPNATLARGTEYRLTVANANVPNMVGQISTTMAEAGLNIQEMINQSRGEIAYTIVDVDSEIPTSVLEAISAIDGVMSARIVQVDTCI